jgi:hypothetical protein
MYNQTAEDLINSIRCFVDIQKSVNTSSSKSDFDKLDELGKIIECKADKIIKTDQIDFVIQYTDKSDTCNTTKKYVYIALGKD